MGKPTGADMIWIKGEGILKKYWNEDYGSLTHHYWNVNKQCIILHTGGWSRNEEIILRLSRTMFWILHWQVSKRGGHYIFAKGFERRRI